MHGHDHSPADRSDLRMAPLQDTVLLYDRTNECAWLRSSVAVDIETKT